jgi:hypothetical protein
VLAPRFGAWVTSGTLRASRRDASLRIGYAASESAALVQVRVSARGVVLHNGRAQRRTEHARGAGSPPRGWIRYGAPLNRALRRGERIDVTVRVRAGGASYVRTFRATVA